MQNRQQFEGELWTYNDEVRIDGKEFLCLVRRLGLEGKRVKITITECRTRTHGTN